MKHLLLLLLVLSAGCIGHTNNIAPLPDGKAELITHTNNPEVFGMSATTVTTHHCDVTTQPEDPDNMELGHIGNCVLLNSTPFAEGGEFGKSFGAAALGAGLGVGLGLQDADHSSMNNSSSSSSKAKNSTYKKRYRY